MKQKVILSCVLILSLAIVSAVNAGITKGTKSLLLHLPFEEAGGKVVKDVSPNKFVGQLTNAKSVDGVVGNALEFNKGSARFDKLNIDPPEALTIEFWFKPSQKITGGSRMDLMYRASGGGRPHITFNRGGVLLGHYFATDKAELEIKRQAKEFDTKWYYYVATQTGSETVLYIDGEEDGKAAAGGSVRIDFIEHGMSIAANHEGGNNFNGAMDEVKIWNVALTADEVKKSMQAALAPTTAVDSRNRLTTKWADIKFNR